MRALFDTHILLDYLRGEQKAANLLQGYETLLVSAVSVAELQLAANNEEQVTQLKGFFEHFEIVPVCAGVAEVAVRLRKQHRHMPMAASCIWASAKRREALLITRNAKAFPVAAASDIRVPY